MSRKSCHLIPRIVLMAATIFAMSLTWAQAPTLQEQLAAQYKLVKMGSDTGGYSVVEKGTLLAIQKGGILAVPYSDASVLSTKYEDGTIHGPSGLAVVGRKSIMGRFGKEQTTHLFAVGDKVYPMKIDVNLAKDSVTVGIVACDTCNKTDPPTYNKANVVFQFPKGALAAADGLAVEKVIGQVLLIGDDAQDDKGGDKAGDQGGQQQGAQDQGQAQQGADQPPAEPASIEKGMSPDQVEAAMGKPEKKVTLGVKVIYYYKDMKVIFMSGKVSDVQ